MVSNWVNLWDRTDIGIGWWRRFCIVEGHPNKDQPFRGWRRCFCRVVAHASNLPKIQI